MKEMAHIMVVDNDKVSRFIARYWIMKLNMARRLTLVADGLEALGYLSLCQLHRKKFPQLILLGLQVQKPDGLEFMAVLKKWDCKFKGEPKVVIMSSDPNIQGLPELKRFNISGIVNKPLTPEILVCLKKMK